MDDIVIKNNNGGTWRIWLVVGIFLIVFIVGVWWLYSWWLAPWLSGASKLNQEKVNIPGIETTDQDKDGLSLKEETRLGTSDNLKDTDSDGLDDKKEVELGTDPLNSDTDHDGYLDGVEVNSGHDPLKK